MGRILVGLLMLACDVACGQHMSCSGGVCRIQPVRGMVRAAGTVLGSIGPDVVIYNEATYSPTIAQVCGCAQPTRIASSGSHWSYPGDIYSHLQRDHGVSGSGMSREQAMALHDRLHEQQRGRTIRRPMRWGFFR